MKWTSYFLIYTVLSSTLVVSHAQGSNRVEGRVLYNISFINGFECIGGQTVGLTDTSIKLEYREVFNCAEFDCEVDDSVRKWRYIATITPEERNGNRSINISCPEAVQGIQLRLLQLEHGGGGCNCWELEELEFTFGSGQTAPISLMNNENMTCASKGNQKNPWLFCDGLATVERGMITTLINLTTNGEEACPGDSAIDLIPPLGPSPTNCSNVLPRIDIALAWDINRIQCPTVEGKDEGVEIAVRAINSTDEDDGDGSWIPLKIFYNGRTSSSENCKGLNSTTERVRGYDVPTVECSNRFTDITLSVCGDNLMRADAVQFRWMGSIFLRNGTSRFWIVDSIRLNLREADKNTTLLSDTFNGNSNILMDDGKCNPSHCNLNSDLWMEPRGGRNDSTCFPSLSGSPARYFVFGDRTGRVYPPNTVFTGILPTQLIPLHLTFNDSGIQATDSPPGPTSQPCPSSGPTTTTQSSTIAGRTTPTIATTLTTAITPRAITRDRELQSIFAEGDPQIAISSLSMYTRRKLLNGSRTAASVYLLGVILNQFNSTGERPNQTFIQNFVGVTEQITRRGMDEVDSGITGSTLLRIVDQFALNVLPNNITLTNRAIAIQTQLLQSTDEDRVTVIDTVNFNDSLFFPQQLSIQIPAELIRMFISTNTSGSAVNGVRAISTVYQNINNLFPQSRPEKNDIGLASGIVSTALQCGNGFCETSEINLINPVLITIEHSTEVKSKVSVGNVSTVCVFWDFSVTESSQGDGILSAGRWSDRGCVKTNTSNSSVTVCKCDHLTHFAILLSARPLNITPAVTLSLQVIGNVGVSVSLVAMALTIITFVAIKPLRNIRSFIHINLCISLGIAQLIFVIGVNRSDPTSDRVPVHCQVTAVLLHYFFLVSFMWMLMEGVVLYIILVTVFVTRTKCYMLVFMLVSYGVPLFYMGLLTLPLGFALPTQPNYGYSRACYLNPGTSFIWTFIVPVLVIILANVGLFIMAAVVMWRHKKRQTGAMTKKDIKKWLLALVPLVVITGLTWILGVLIVEVKELLPFAYIYTIMVAFQGLFIFLLFIIFPKQVRDECTKWWRTKAHEYFGKNKEATKTIITGQTSNSKMNANTNVSGSGGFKSWKVEEVVLESKAELSLIKENPTEEDRRTEEGKELELESISELHNTSPRERET